MRLTSTLATGVALATLLLGGCSTSNPGTADSTTTAPARATSSVAAVANPLDVAKIQKDPCGALSAAQLAPFMGEIRNATPDLTNGDFTCNWDPSDVNKLSVSVNVYPTIGGPAGVYSAKTGYNYFEKIDSISGYPAVHAATGTNAPRNGLCRTIVAVSDKAAFDVFAQNSTSSDPHYATMCTVTDQLVQQVITNLTTQH